MELKIGKVTVPCGICGGEYEANVINEHITYPHICNKCLKDILKEWEESKK